MVIRKVVKEFDLAKNIDYLNFIKNSNNGRAKQYKFKLIKELLSNKNKWRNKAKLKKRNSQFITDFDRQIEKIEDYDYQDHDEYIQKISIPKLHVWHSDGVVERNAQKSLKTHSWHQTYEYEENLPKLVPDVKSDEEKKQQQKSIVSEIHEELFPQQFESDSEDEQNSQEKNQIDYDLEEDNELNDKEKKTKIDKIFKKSLNMEQNGRIKKKGKKTRVKPVQTTKLEQLIDEVEDYLNEGKDTVVNYAKNTINQIFN